MLVHILECPHELGIEGSCKNTKQLIVAPVFGLYFVMYGFENKMALYTLFSQFFNEYFCFPFHQHLTFPPHSLFRHQTPSSFYLGFLAALNEEHYKGTDRGLL